MTLDDKILELFIKHNMLTTDMTQEQVHHRLCGSWPPRLIDDLEVLLHTEKDKSEDPIKKNWPWLLLSLFGVVGLVIGVQFLSATHHSLWWLIIAVICAGVGFFGMFTFSKKLHQHRAHSSQMIAQYLKNIDKKV